MAPPNPQAGVPTSASEFVASVGPVPKVFPLTTSGWKEDEKLAYERDNWREFSSKVENQLGMIPGAARFLNSSPEDPNLCPSFQLYPAHHRAWMETNNVVLAFLRDVLTITERTHIAHCSIAADAWATLRYRHLVRGPAGQISALKRFASITYASDPKTFAATTTLLTQCNESVWQCGPSNPELFLLSGIISALETNHPTIASTLLAQPNLTLAMALASLDAKQLRNQDENSSSGSTVFAANMESCTNRVCPKPSTHTWPYCTSKGGGMDGKTILEAQQKYRADRDRLNGKTPSAPKQKPPQVKHDATGRACITLQGVEWFLTPAAAPAPPTNLVASMALADAANTLHTDILPAVGDVLADEKQLEAWLADEEPHVALSTSLVLLFAFSPFFACAKPILSLFTLTTRPRG
ncbi:hypothetical protein B0H13DRAFT_1877400 [Mycena leptocephala]|nr:hypothetical protein B0H13DRAFT_1877400 [Mycena leptocephala]